MERETTGHFSYEVRAKTPIKARTTNRSALQLLIS